MGGLHKQYIPILKWRHPERHKQSYPTSQRWDTRDHKSSPLNPLGFDPAHPYLHILDLLPHMSTRRTSTRLSTGHQETQQDSMSVARKRGGSSEEVMFPSAEEKKKRRKEVSWQRLIRLTAAYANNTG